MKLKEGRVNESYLPTENENKTAKYVINNINENKNHDNADENKGIW